MTRSPLPHLTLAFWGWAALDLIGVLILALGAAYLMEERASIVAGFPASPLQAWACLGAGVATVLVAAIKMLVEVLHSASRRGEAANDSRIA